jgi:hypothetical protein
MFRSALPVILVSFITLFGAGCGAGVDDSDANGEAASWATATTDSDGNPVGSSSPTPGGFPGQGNPGFGTPGGSGSPGGGNFDDQDQGERCNIDAECSAEAPYCSVAGYCLACLEDAHCPTGRSCTNGFCLADVCTPSETMCSGDTLLTCDAQGATWTEMTCPGSAGQCVDGACTGCDPGYTACVGKDQRVVCSADGLTLTTETCGGGFCADGACLECYPGTSQCEGSWVQTCNAMGEWELVQDCGATMGQCSGGMCQSACGGSGKLSNEGCDYWAIDMDNEGPAKDSPYAVIVSNLNSYSVSITVSSKTSAGAAPNTVASGTIQPGDVEVFQLPQQNMGQSGLFWKALRLQSTGPIVAYQFNPLENVAVFSNDASLLLPSQTFGQEYVVVSREEIPASGLETYRGSIAIVATAEATTVTLTPSAPTQAGYGIPQLEAGETTQFVLEPYQVMNIQSDMLGADLTGSIVLADKPIGVFGGHEAAVSSDQCCADHLEQQLFPVDTWGKTYVASKSRARGIEKDYWRIVAAYDGTSVTVSPSLPGVPSPISLNRGDFYEIKTDADFVIESTEPVMVAQTLASSQEIAGPAMCMTSAECAEGYSCSFVSPECMIDTPYCTTTSDCPHSHSCSCGDLGFCTCEPIGDPALILAVPVEQYRSSYVFLTPTNYLDDYINIVAPQSATVILDGQELGTYAFKALSGSSYKIARLSVSDGVHSVEANQPVGVIAYGYDDDVSYGYPAGLDLSVQP